MDLMQIAADILERGPEAAIGEPMTARQRKNWRDAAQMYIDYEGEDPDLQLLLDERDLFEEFHSVAFNYEMRTGRDFQDFEIWQERR